MSSSRKLGADFRVVHMRGIGLLNDSYQIDVRHAARLIDLPPKQADFAGQYLQNEGKGKWEM